MGQRLERCGNLRDDRWVFDRGRDDVLSALPKKRTTLRPPPTIRKILRGSVRRNSHDQKRCRASCEQRQPTAPTPEQFWYYCQPAGAYSPNAQTCTEP